MAYNQTCILIQNCVGIGTDTPLGSLTVKQTSGDGGANGGISILNDNNELKGSLFAGGSVPRPYGHLLLRDASNCDAVMFRTTGASNFILCGNFGIGTATPSGKLQVHNSSTQYAIYSTDGNLELYAAESTPGYVRFGSAYSLPGLYGGAGLNYIVETGYSHVFRRGSTAIMTVSSSGAMQMSRVASDITFPDNVGGMYVRQNGNGAGTEEELRIFGRNISLVSHTGTRYMDVTSTGNVGIGTSSPSYKLHVNGTFYAAGSSQDYKQSICNYNTDSCMFMKLKPVTYQYKEEYCHLGKELKSGTQIGLIAEEVAETYPELAILVNEEENKVVRNVDYEKLSVILLSEVQKLRREVEDLKHK